MTAISVKAVIIDDGRVLLLANDRGEWELPGGRVDPGESESAALLREIEEELGVQARIGHRLADELFEVIPGRHVRIVSYGCAIQGAGGLRLSEEHRDLLWARLGAGGDLPGDLPVPGVYRRAISLWAEMWISFKNP